jgi:hypothetical protein
VFAPDATGNSPGLSELDGGAVTVTTDANVGRKHPNLLRSTSAPGRPPRKDGADQDGADVNEMVRGPTGRPEPSDVDRAVQAATTPSRALRPKTRSRSSLAKIAKPAVGDTFGPRYRDSGDDCYGSRFDAET